MKSNDYVKYITQTVVKYIDQPKDERKKSRLEKKNAKEPFLLKWFGIIPYAIYDLFNRKK
ncbi:YqzE family protein [Cytobacillus praedii]|uniref:YqzE family protein n=1 Tax=Cytobacillus praedii TaxID=1742358 RepID=UPI002E1BA347|nr:YqzE family protein [Cytobacillus praedii]